jgi:hypothetical protein
VADYEYLDGSLENQDTDNGLTTIPIPTPLQKRKDRRKSRDTFLSENINPPEKFPVPGYPLQRPPSAYDTIGMPPPQKQDWVSKPVIGGDIPNAPEHTGIEFAFTRKITVDNPAGTRRGKYKITRKSGRKPKSSRPMFYGL